MKSQTEAPADWLLTEILTGLQKLSMLRLANGPQGEQDLEGCALAWLESLETQRGWHIGERDAIREAFRRLMARKPAEGRPVFWPAPGDLIAEMGGANSPQAPYHQPFAIEWDQHQVKNRSLTAKSHVTFDCARLEIPVPKWALPDSDAESEAILAMIGQIKAQERDRKRHLAERQAA